MEFYHESVLLEECIEGLKIKADGIYVDCTTGGAGHSEKIAARLRGGLLICIDQDSEAIEAAQKRLIPFQGKVTFVKENFSKLKNILKDLRIEKVDGLLYDLGVSSHQIDSAQRGFSYINDAPLDMRMSKENPLTAKEIANGYDKNHLMKIFREYGEEKYAAQIAEKILKAREKKEIQTTKELSDIIESALPARVRYEGGHPAKRVFQAIRIEVNGELSILEKAINDGIDVLNQEGRICAISFHSLEDRIVKHVMKERAMGCKCPKEFPVCVCHNQPEIKIISKKPMAASKKEAENNSRSKSAKLRIAEKI